MVHSGRCGARNQQQQQAKVNNLNGFQNEDNIREEALEEVGSQNGVYHNDSYLSSLKASKRLVHFVHNCTIFRLKVCGQSWTFCALE